MVARNPCSTMTDTKSKLIVGGDPVSDPTLYRSLDGAPQYLTFTRPDIAYNLKQFFFFMHDPCVPYFHALKCILRYLHGTLKNGIHIRPSAVDRLVSYYDVDSAGCPTTRSSTFGFCVYLSNNLISWYSKQKYDISCSIIEAEYQGVAKVVAETVRLQNLLLEL
ncbi:hypothetical protein Lser_V15G36786 [Lactuca serriola]